MTLQENGYDMALKENTKAIERLEQSLAIKNKLYLGVIAWFYLITIYGIWLIWQIMKYNMITKLLIALS